MGWRRTPPEVARARAAQVRLGLRRDVWVVSVMLPAYPALRFNVLFSTFDEAQHALAHFNATRRWRRGWTKAHHDSFAAHGDVKLSIYYRG